MASDEAARECERDGDPSNGCLVSTDAHHDHDALLGGDLPPVSQHVEPRKKAGKKQLDPQARARKRVQQRVQQEVKAARKARKRERKKKRRGQDADLEEFLKRTQERLEKSAIEAEARAFAASRAAIMEQASRASSNAPGSVESYVALTKNRVDGQMQALERARQAQEEATKARALARAAGADLEAFQKKTQARIAARMWEKLPQVQDGRLQPADLLEGGVSAMASAFTRRRVAIVGAGPVGLWAAVLLQQRYARLGERVCKRPDAPEVVILETRPEEKHCSRKDIRISLSTSTCALLGKRARVGGFCNAMALSEIEEALLRSLKKLGTPPIQFGRDIESPTSLLEEKFDCILWAGGRRSLKEESRAALGCKTRIGESERVLVFQLGDLDGSSAELAQQDLTSVVRQAAECPSLRVMMRPSLGLPGAGFLWLFGLPTEAVEAALTLAPGRLPCATMEEAFDSAIKTSASCHPGLRRAVEALQRRLRPESCGINWVEASHWSADRVVCPLPHQEDGAELPFVLLGDAASGRPFYTGSTLNRHFFDVASMIDDVEWANDGRDFGPDRFAGYERRYQADILRISDFRRRGHARHDNSVASEGAGARELSPRSRSAAPGLDPRDPLALAAPPFSPKAPRCPESPAKPLGVCLPHATSTGSSAVDGRSRGGSCGRALVQLPGGTGRRPHSAVGSRCAGSARNVVAMLRERT